MGGKGGGGVQPYNTWVDHIATYPQPFERNRSRYATEADWYANYGGGQDNPQSNLISPEMSRDIFTKMYGTYKPPPAPAPAPAAAAPPPPAPAPAPAAPVPPPVGGTPIDPGGAIDQPLAADNGLGDALGGAILKPPQYWVGGVDSYNTADTASGRGQGAIKTQE